MNAIFPWLATSWQQLISYKSNNMLPSSLLISGPKGIGKFELAQGYAQLILCQKSGSEACGECRSCLLFKAETHPDFFIVQPEEKSQTIKIEQIRDLIEALAQTSALSGHQVVIISLAEQMNKAAANSLLKTLEEPRGQVLILLLSNQPTSIPATILSRCQQVKIPLPSQTDVEPWLSTQISSKTVAAVCLSVADNLPLKALDYAKSDKQALRDTLLTYLHEVQRDAIDPTTAAAQCVTSPDERLCFLMTLTMDMIRIKFSAKEFLNHRDKIALLSALCCSVSVRQLFKFLDQILEATKLLTNRNNVNVQLLMEKIFINWRYNNDVS